MKKYILFLSIIFFTACGVQPKNSRDASREDKNGVSANTVLPKLAANKPAEQKNDAQKEAVPLLKAFSLDVPFTSQAPFANWDELHNEACEEASMIMADAFFKKRTLNKEIAESEIQKFVKWQNENGYTYDVTSAEVAQILKDYFGLSAEISALVTAENIKKTLSAGKLIIIPAAGRTLGNPNFKRPGPLYHMLVLRGYDERKKEFVTNDPGTRKGEGYRYGYNTLINAIHDWPKQGKGKEDVSEEEMRDGRKVMIIVSRPGP